MRFPLNPNANFIAGLIGVVESPEQMDFSFASHLIPAPIPYRRFAWFIGQLISSFRTTKQQPKQLDPTPNHALQRTRPAVTPAASSRRLSPTTQRSRQPGESLSLGSLGVSSRPV